MAVAEAAAWAASGTIVSQDPLQASIKLLRQAASRPLHWRTIATECDPRSLPYLDLFERAYPRFELLTRKIPTTSALAQQMMNALPPQGFEALDTAPIALPTVDWSRFDALAFARDRRAFLAAFERPLPLWRRMLAIVVTVLASPSRLTSVRA